MSGFAKPDTIPELGQTWLPIGDKPHIMTLQLFDIAVIRPLVPDRFQIVSVLPGKTLGGVLLSHYGPGSTLEYHELGIMPALVRFGSAIGFWVSHLSVDNVRSQEGGNRLGLNKQLSDFEWQGLDTDTAHIFQNGHAIFSLSYHLPKVRLRFPVSASALTSLDGQVLRFSNTLTANYGLGRVRYTIPKTSELCDIGLVSPSFALIGNQMTGLMAHHAQEIGK